MPAGYKNMQECMLCDKHRSNEGSGAWLISLCLICTVINQSINNVSRCFMHLLIWTSGTFTGKKNRRISVSIRTFRTPTVAPNITKCLHGSLISYRGQTCYWIQPFAFASYYFIVYSTIFSLMKGITRRWYSWFLDVKVKYALCERVHRRALEHSTYNTLRKEKMIFSWLR